MAGNPTPPRATRYADLPLDRALQFHALEESSPFAHDTACARYRFAAGLLNGGERVLDLGCGPGFGCPILLRGGAAAVTGLDEQAEMIEYASRRYAQPGITFVAGSGLDHRFPDGAFELVTAFEVIEHLTDPRALLDRAARWLTPGGRLVVSTPNRLVHQLMGITWPFHEREYGSSDLLALFEPVFDRGHLAFYGQNPSLVEHFRLRRGRFTPVRSPIPGPMRAIIPRALVDAVRRVVPRKPRPVSPSDPDLIEACRIEARDLDTCETFLVVASRPE